MLKIVWRFNLRDGVDETEFWSWLRQNVWSSSAAYGCATVAFAVSGGTHRWSTEATWPDEDARRAWSASPDFAALPPWPGSDTPWGAQVDMEAAEYRPL